MAQPTDHPYAQWDGDTLILRCKIQPKSSRDAFVGVLGERFKIAITAPPVDGKANTHLIKMVAKNFGVSRSSVTITQGLTGRNKTLQINAPTRIPDAFQALQLP